MNINSDLVEMIYDVPLGHSDWLDVLNNLQAEFHAIIGFMFISPPDQPPTVIRATCSDESSVWNPYTEHFWKIDPWHKVLNADKVLNRMARGSDFYSHKQLTQTEYFNDWWRYIDLYYTAGGKLETSNGITVQLGIPREKKAGEFTDAEIVLFNCYARHIKRAIELEGITGRSLPYPVYEFALNSRFGLTTAEAKLVLTLFKTNSLPSAAENLHRSYHTVRNQMKTIYQKTETSNQLELYQLVSA